MNNELVFYFNNYLNMGLKPIILKFGSKKPLLKNWNESYNPKLWKHILDKDKEKKFNIAILLGKVVDVEGDTEDANELLKNIIGNYKHPCFKSSRSVHHLFINPDSELTVKKFHDIEFRANKVCSVMPPSVHEDGTKYRFLKDCQFPIPVMPDSLLDFYRKNKKEHDKSVSKTKYVKPKTKKDHTKTLCHKCRKYKFVHKKRLALEVHAFILKNLSWSCQECREIDVREMCRLIRGNQI